MNFLRLRGNQRGVTLIELIVAMIVISVALGGVLLVMNYTSARSADPVLRHQALAIAEAYLEEVTLQSYLDPDNGLPCPAKEGSRALYDNVCDYNGLNDAGARTQGNPGAVIPGLENYLIAIAVASDQPFGTPAVTGFKIDVTVTDPAGESLTLTGYRTNF